MTWLITQVRTLTAAGTAEYQVGTANYWDDDQVQQVLDRHRVDIFRERLDAQPTYAGAGSVAYTIHYSGFGNLEAGTALFIEDSVGTKRGTATYSVDHQVGRIEFTADQAGTALYLTARSYDPFGAAAEVLESWAANEARCFDFATDGQSFQASQKAKSLRDQARLLRKHARVRVKRLRTNG